MRTYTSQARQTLFDLALLIYGRAELAFDLAEANDLCLSEAPGGGVELRAPVPDGDDDTAVADFYNLNGVDPATAPDEEAFSELTPEGISYWAIYAPAPVFFVSPDNQ